MAENDFKIDLDAQDFSALPEEININTDINPLEAPPPVDDGVHRVKLILDNNSFEQRETKENKQGNKTTFIMVKFSGQVLAEGTRNNNKRVFNLVNTLVFDGKSEMGYIIRKALGDTPEAKASVEGIKNYGQLATAFRDTLAAEPIIRVETKWVAQRKVSEEGKKDKYETVLSGQKNFPLIDPKDPGKGHRHVIVDPKTKTEIAAQAVIQDYFAD
jgi:hypothetical protein